MQTIRGDIAIIGGGPAGTTVAALLKKYSPDLKVIILEREKFPRDHVGESQLPVISHILSEMGVWDKVEEAGFPVKLGGTYRWGATDELWYLDFVHPQDFIEMDRPQKFEGQRLATAFQVDRSVYDKILLDHARDMGCDVYEEATVKDIPHGGDFITGLQVHCEELGGDVLVKARYYVDASGETGILRRAMGVETQIPTTLRNLAFWDYWHDAEWAEMIGKGGVTRIQVMSLGWGWIWFIPISATRTSVGLVLPASYYKDSGKRPEELYAEALAAEPLVSSLLKNARSENNLQATKDWNFLSDRLAGENWFLVGDSCGFADPILSAGMTLSHTSAQKAAYSILELYRKQLDPQWIRDQYSQGHRLQVHHHMRFAEFWYAGNGKFTDLKAYCSEIAESVGLKLNADDAFRWLGTGGFALDNPGLATAATFPLSGVKHMASNITGTESTWKTEQFNYFTANLQGAVREPFAYYDKGSIKQVVCLCRGHAKLPMGGIFSLILPALEHVHDQLDLLNLAIPEGIKRDLFKDPEQGAHLISEALEALLEEGWITAAYNPNRPLVKGVPPSAGTR